MDETEDEDQYDKQMKELEVDFGTFFYFTGQFYLSRFYSIL